MIGLNGRSSERGAWQPDSRRFVRRGGMQMEVKLKGVLLALGTLALAEPGVALAAEEKAACPAEVSQAAGMVAQAQTVLKGGSPKGTQLARTPTGDPASGAGVLPAPSPGTGTGGGRTPQGAPASGAGRGLATSSASEITPWNPTPTDKMLKARTAKARKLTAQARRLCKAGKLDEARAKANEAIRVLDPK